MSQTSEQFVETLVERWRLMGNQAYRGGNLRKAEEYYTSGLNCASSHGALRSCLGAVVLCYSDRALTRMSLGRMREAIEDCMKASTIDPKFLKVEVTSGSCYLALGEIDDAGKCFMKCF
uniref:Uncharacterized protein n=1 Tax=Nelumbo nucifera TaxID=4432 RepID=A0A822ZEZ1_NELNU|nr:TPA_asm: hypothetical protein HUJ06_001922 [Nelumbo nucifera]